jgi:DNA invertase Pin-like site-specific DNA recombinase
MCVGLIDQPIELAAAPANAELELALELSEHSAERSERQLVDSTALRPRDGLLTHAGPPGEVNLPPAPSKPERSDDAADTDRMHQQSISCGTHLAIADSASRGRDTYAWDQSHIEALRGTTYGSRRSPSNS